MMDKNANYIMVGTFVIGIMVLGVMVGLWTYGGFFLRNSYPLKIVFQDSVLGLEKGSTVYFNGVNVGDVKKIEVSADRVNEVYVYVNLDSSLPIHAGVEARLTTSLLTKASSILLSGGDLSKPLISKLSKQELVTIYSAGNLANNPLEALTNLSSKAEHLLKKLDLFVSNNSVALDQTIKNIQQFSQTLEHVSPTLESLKSLDFKHVEDLINNTNQFIVLMNGESNSIKQIVNNMNQFSQKLLASTTHADQLMHNLNTLLATDDNQNIALLDHLDSATQAVQNSAESFKVLVTNLDRRTDLLTNHIDLFLSTTLNRIEEISSRGNQTLMTLNHIVKDIDNDPKQLIMGKSPKLPSYR